MKVKKQIGHTGLLVEVPNTNTEYCEVCKIPRKCGCSGPRSTAQVFTYAILVLYVVVRCIVVCPQCQQSIHINTLNTNYIDYESHQILIFLLLVSSQQVPDTLPYKCRFIVICIKQLPVYDITTGQEFTYESLYTPCPLCGDHTKCT